MQLSVFDLINDDSDGQTGMIRENIYSIQTDMQGFKPAGMGKSETEEKLLEKFQKSSFLELD